MISILKQMAFNKNKKKVEKSIIKLKVIIFFNFDQYFLTRRRPDRNSHLNRSQMHRNTWEQFRKIVQLVKM